VIVSCNIINDDGWNVFNVIKTTQNGHQCRAKYDTIVNNSVILQDRYTVTTSVAYRTLQLPNLFH